jgi:hypothetical protein
LTWFHRFRSPASDGAPVCWPVSRYRVMSEPGGRDLGVPGAADIAAADPKLLACNAEADPLTHGRHPAFRH